MQRRHFTLEPGKPPRVAIFWGLIGGKGVTMWDKKQIGVPFTLAEFEAGRQYEFPDGSRLRIKLIPAPETADPTPEPLPAPDEEDALPPSAQVQVWYNGQPLTEVPGYGAQENVRYAVGITFFVGLMDLVLGGYVFSRFHIVPRPLITGLIFLGIALGIKLEQTWAARLGVIVAGLDMMMTILTYTRIGGANSNTLLTVVARLLVIWALLRAVDGLRELKRQSSEPQTMATVTQA